MVKTVRHSAVGAIGRSIPAKHVHYFGLVIGTYYWPTELIKNGQLEASENGAYHCTSVYGVSKLNMVLGFPGGVLLSMADFRSRS